MCVYVCVWVCMLVELSICSVRFNGETFPIMFAETIKWHNDRIRSVATYTRTYVHVYTVSAVLKT